MTKKSYLLVSIVSLLVLAVGVSVAYFTVQIEGTGKTMSVDTANLRVIFTDTNAAIDATDIKPGWEAYKTFTVESKTDAAYDYNIVVKNLVNTFVTEGYLQYQIVGSNGGVSQGWTDVPKSATATDTVLVHSVPLAVNAKHTYTVNFRYLNSDSVDQSADMGKSFSGSIMITEGTTAGTWAYTTSYTDVYLNQAMPTGISYPTAAEAMAQFDDIPYYNKHLVENGIVTESYVEFIVTEAMASANSGMTAGTYALKGADTSAYNANKQVLDTAFGSTHCSEGKNGIGNDVYSCSVSGLRADAYSSGAVYAFGGDNANCYVNSGGSSSCIVPTDGK